MRQTEKTTILNEDLAKLVELRKQVAELRKEIDRLEHKTNFAQRKFCQCKFCQFLWFQRNGLFPKTAAKIEVPV